MLSDVNWGDLSSTPLSLQNDCDELFNSDTDTDNYDGEWFEQFYKKNARDLSTYLLKR